MEENLSTAQDIVFRFSEDIEAQRLEAILDVLSEEVTLQSPDYRQIEGKPQVRQFYEDRFNSGGQYRFDLEITETRNVSDLVFINGSMTRTIIREDGSPDTTPLEFSFILRMEDGAMKIWQMRAV